MNVKRLLILTGTIDPGNMIFTNRNNINERMQDYIKSLKYWLNNNKDGYFNKIIFCENSGYDLSEIKESLVSLSNKNEVVFFQWSDNHKWTGLGKGYGEAKMLEYLNQEAYELIQEHDYIVKVTGRLYIPNINRVFNKKDEKMGVSIIHHRLKQIKDENNMFVDSRLFCIASACFSEFIKDFSNDINDNNGVYFEHVLASRIHYFNRMNKKTTNIFKELPFYIGYSGTSGQKLNSIKSTIKFHLKNSMYKAYYRVISIKNI